MSTTASTLRDCLLTGRGSERGHDDPSRVTSDGRKEGRSTLVPGSSSTGLSHHLHEMQRGVSRLCNLQYTLSIVQYFILQYNNLTNKIFFTSFRILFTSLLVPPPPKLNLKYAWCPRPSLVSNTAEEALGQTVFTSRQPKKTWETLALVANGVGRYLHLPRRVPPESRLH